MVNRRTFYLVIFLAATAGLAFTPPVNKYFEIIKNLEIFTNLYKEINSGYVDELDPARTMRIGIDAMLNALDPYTNYISESEIEGYKAIAEGKYKGIGAQVKKIGEYVTILQVYENSPALKAGLKAGDRVLEVDGQNAKNRSTDDLNNIMQGVPGTQIQFKIERPCEKKPFSLTLTREEVDIPNVPYSGMVSDEIGYISLTTFTQMASANIVQAFNDLKSRNPGMKGIILDLRDNGGGLLNEAVNICNIFIPKGEVVVSTKGKTTDQNRVFKTTGNPVDTEIPLVILVNGRSASASEIVSGTIQDLDRGVVMGQLTFGKGLVQNTKEIGYNSRLKLTTSKYYIPSGRCIQAVRYKDGAPAHIPDNERARFKTRNGRVVLDGGGVMPDVILDTIVHNALVRTLLEQDVLFEYANKYCFGRDSIASPDQYHFDGWEGFVKYLSDTKFQFDLDSEKALKKLVESATREKTMSNLQPQIQQMEQGLAQRKEMMLNENKSEIVRMLELEIIGRYYFDKGRKKIALRNDTEINAAVALLGDKASYKKILSGK